MSRLYEITERYKELEQVAESDDMALALKDTFEAIEGEFEEKAVALIKVVRNTDSDIDQVDAEIKRLQDRKRVLVNAKESMKEYLRSNMEATGIKKIECPIFKITHRVGAEILVIEDEGLIPEDYMIVPDPIIKPDKKRLLSDLKEGKTIPGVHKERGKSSILIK